LAQGIKIGHILVPFIEKERRYGRCSDLSATRNSFSAKGIKISLIFVLFRQKESGCAPFLFLSPKRNQDPSDVSIFALKGIKMPDILIPFGEKKPRCDASSRLSPQGMKMRAICSLEGVIGSIPALPINTLS